MRKLVVTSHDWEQEKLAKMQEEKGGYCVYRKGKWRIQKGLRIYNTFYVLKGSNWEKRVAVKHEKQDIESII